MQICLAVGLTGWLSFRNGQESVNELASQLQSEISDRISEKTSSYLHTPRAINQISAEEVRVGRLNLDRPSDLIRHFTYMQRIFKNINHVAWGTEKGEYLGVRRSLKPNDLNEFELLLLNQETPGKLLTYGLNTQGNRTQLLSTKENYDPRSRPWYQDGIVDRKPRWSRIYQYFRVSPLGISHTHPIYRNGALLGVLATDFDLGEISGFLQSLRIGRSGHTFLIERNGNMVASSTVENLFAIDPQGQTRQIKAIESKDPLVAGTAAYLIQKFGNLSEIRSNQKTILQTSDVYGQKKSCRLSEIAICVRTEIKTAVFEIIGNRQFLQVTSLKNDEGVDWLLVVVIPESDFMDRIHANTKTTILLCAIALVVAIAIGLVTSHWISQPILRLGKASSSIANFSTNIDANIEPPVAENHSIGELETLANSFNHMAQQLRNSFMALRQANEELEQRVADRTEALQRLALLDGLTQVANRRRFDQYLAQVWQDLSITQQPMALILCDVDCFKLFNDHYGHQMGDECLIQVAQAILQVVSHTFKDSQLVARYGGEEFVVILPNTDAQTARQVGEEMRNSIASLQIPHIASYVTAHITLSIGATSLIPTVDTSPQDSIAKADRALYTAKNEGRDRTVLLL